VAATLEPPPRKYGVTRWSSRLLARHLGIGNATVARAWREYGVAPRRVETFKFSTDPESDLAAKEATLRRLSDPNPATTRFRPGDRLLAFLDTL
jgi:hypothetical protein